MAAKRLPITDAQRRQIERRAAERESNRVILAFRDAMRRHGVKASTINDICMTAVVTLSGRPADR